MVFYFKFRSQVLSVPVRRNFGSFIIFLAESHPKCSASVTILVGGAIGAGGGAGGSAGGEGGGECSATAVVVVGPPREPRVPDAVGRDGE